ncbi:MAG: patatin-like phospholipase family protein [Actinomycetes bacterium]
MVEGRNGDSSDPHALRALLRESPVFGGLDDGALDLLERALELRSVARGERFIRLGDPADGLYLIASGRVAVSVPRPDGDLVIDEHGRGHVVGEMSLLTDRPRSADVTARRDSHLFFLPTAAFDELVLERPGAWRSISTALIDKLALVNRGVSTSSPATTIAFVPLDDTEPCRDFVAACVAEIGRLSGSARLVTPADAAAELGPGASALDQATWREALERTWAVVAALADPEFTAWTDACVQHADRVVLVADATRTPSRRAVEQEMAARAGSGGQRCELVLLHPPSTQYPRGTRHWLTPREVHRHHHVRTDRPTDVARVARLLTDRGVGIVFAGGGARGIAHIGVLRALEARGVPIDAVGGASIGSIVGGSVARGDTPDELARILRAAVLDRSPVDVTLPTVSFAQGARVTQQIRDAAGGLDLEDGWRNFYCVSTNLTRASLEVHRRGPGWFAIRSSFSIPGVFPPMHTDDDEILVDGGMLDNMPIATMRELHAGIRVIAVDVGAHKEFGTAGATKHGAVSGWRTLASALRRRSVGDAIALPKLLMRLTELGAVDPDDLGDCYVRPGLEGISLLDFDRFDDLTRIGEQDAGPVLDGWLADQPDLRA